MRLGRERGPCLGSRRSGSAPRSGAFLPADGWYFPCREGRVPGIGGGGGGDEALLLLVAGLDEGEVKGAVGGLGEVAD